MNTGIVKKELRLPFVPLYYLSYFGHNYYLFTGRSGGTKNNQVTILDDSLKAIGQTIPYKINSSVCFLSSQPLQNIDKSLYCLPVYDQTIYKINQLHTQFIPAYSLDFGRHNMPIQALETNPKYTKSQDWLETPQKEDFIMFLNYYMLNQNIFFTFSLHGDNLFGMYNIKNQKSVVIDKITDLPFLKNNYPVGVVDGSLVFAIDCDKIDLSKKYPAKLSKLLTSVRPDDNQIILILKPKIQ